MDIKKTLIYFIFFGIIISFFGGFILGENSAGAGGYVGDLSWIKKNIEIFKNNTTLEAIKHPDIFGNRPPLIYIINKFFNPFFYDLERYRICVFVLSLVGPFFLFIGLKIKFKNIKTEYLAVLSVLILLSPYYRTSGFWALNENYGVISAIISLMFLNLSLLKNSLDGLKEKFYLLCTVFFSSSCVYLDQKLVIIPIICFFSFFYYLKKTSTRIFIFFGYAFLSMPFLYLIYLWNGIVPIKTQTANPNTITNLSRINDFYFINIGYATTMISFYLLPFMLFKENLFKNLSNFYQNKKNILLIILAFIYVLLLINYFDFKKYTVDEYWVGLGYIDKITKILFSNVVLREFFTYFSFLASWLVLILFLEKKYLNILIILYFYFISILLWPLMQEYFDPIIVIFGLIIFSNKVKINFYNTVFSVLYFSLFLISANIYY